MLRLRSSILVHLLSSSPAASPASHLHRLISGAAPAIPPNPSGFTMEEYLVSTCGLTHAHAVKASAKLSHLKSPAKLDGSFTSPRERGAPNLSPPFLSVLDCQICSPASDQSLVRRWLWSRSGQGPLCPGEGERSSSLLSMRAGRWLVPGFFSGTSAGESHPDTAKSSCRC
uniref:Predicted protein n=1 Tax=Hordeum vulgare subsp. vulgare TaxID=112509 RepID=F2EKA9_HORVV|nr:predicted protein [Hordeum vulgare subsp. vulgare]